MLRIFNNFITNMLKTIQKTLDILVIVVILIAGGVYLYDRFVPKGGLGFVSSGQRTIGPMMPMASTTDGVFVNLPAGAYDGDATTTSDGATKQVDIGGKTVQQKYAVDGFSSLNIMVQAKGGTATSTMYIHFLISPDGTSWYPIRTTATTTDTAGTTTPQLTQKAITWVPSLVTSTAQYIVTFPASKYLRIEPYATDIDQDPNDGVKAYLQYTFIE
jgi:hypothetical protein